jgi:hypothetical protein
MGRTKDKTRVIILGMPAARCRVSFTDSDGISHVANVQAESLYEAVALAVAEFREDPMVQAPGAMTEFNIAIEKPAVEHHIRLNQVEKWARSTTREGPAGITKRERVRTLLAPNLR